MPQNTPVPDLSALVQTILQNPSLVRQIADLTHSVPAGENPTVHAPVGGDAEAQPVSTPVSKEESAVHIPQEMTEESAPVHAHARREHASAQVLLEALKPYVSQKRVGAIDSMIQVMHLMDAVHKV